MPTNKTIGIRDVPSFLFTNDWDVTSKRPHRSQVELDTAFIDAGMDSLSGVSLVSMLNRDFETALTPSVAPRLRRWGPNMGPL